MPSVFCNLLRPELFGACEVFANRVLNTRQCFFFSGALRPAPRKAKAGYTITVLGWQQSDWGLHAFTVS
jgi:hypothetical protein